MSNVLWPQLHGLSWELKRIPGFKTAVQPGSAVGRETRVGFGSDPADNWELAYKILRFGTSQSGWQNEIERIDAFFRARKGSLDSFLLDAGNVTKNPAWSSVTAQPLVVDINGCAPLVRTIASGYDEAYDEAIYELNVDGSGNQILPTIKHSGTPLVRNVDYKFYNFPQVDTGVLNANGITYSGCVVQFIASPAITSNVTADFGWTYRVRFEADEQEWSLFHYLLWEAQSIKLMGTRY